MRVCHYKNLTQLTFLPHLFPVNAYVYEEKDSLTIIDMGVKSFVKIIQEISKRADKPVKALILTHAHIDHVSGLDTFKQVFPKATIIISRRDAKVLKGDLRIEAQEPALEIKRGNYKIATQPDLLVNAGERIGSLEVIATPGHTPGSISLYAPAIKALIVGDALQCQGGLAVAGDTRLLFPFPAQAIWSKALALESAKKLLQKDIEVLATGHGKMLAAPKAKMTSVILRLERKQQHEKKD